MIKNKYQSYIVILIDYFCCAVEKRNNARKE